MLHHFKPPTLLPLDEKKERHATWLELFFDLVFVVAITQLSDRLVHHFNFLGILQVVTLSIFVIWCWDGHTVYATRFDTDDIVHGMVTFVIMFAAAIMSVQIPTAFEQGANGFAAGYVLARIMLLFLYLRVLFYNPQLKAMSLLYLIGFGLGASCWIFSFLASFPTKFWLWGLGIGIDMMTPWIGKRKILSKIPVNASHLPERLGLFTIIVIGECVAAVILGLSSTSWGVTTIIASILAFILAILFWLQYFTFLQTANYQHRLNSGQSFIYLHFPIVICLVIASVSLQKIIIIASGVNFEFEMIKSVFLAATVVWLMSLFSLQYFTLTNYSVKSNSIIYMSSILLVTFLFFIPLLPLATLVVVDVLILLLILIEIYLRTGRIIN